MFILSDQTSPKLFTFLSHKTHSKSSQMRTSHSGKFCICSWKWWWWCSGKIRELRTAPARYKLLLHCLLLLPYISVDTLWLGMLFWLILLDVRVKGAKAESDVSWSCPVTWLPITVSDSKYYCKYSSVMWACSSEPYLYTYAQAKETILRTTDVLSNVSKT